MTAHRNSRARPFAQPERIGLLLVFALLAACDRAGEAANNQADTASNAATSQPEGDVGKAERLVRERLRNPQGLTFANPVRTASGTVAIVCGEYRQGGDTHRYVVVAGEDVYLEPEVGAVEMERGYSEFCREDGGSQPPPPAAKGNGQ